MDKITNHITNYNAFYTLIVSLIVAVINIVYVILTYKLLKENRLMREQQIQPNIVIDFELLNNIFPVIKIANIGNGFANNIKIVSKPELPNMINELSSLPPGKSLNILVILSDDITKLPELITFSINYMNPLAQTKKDDITLDLRPYRGLISLKEHTDIQEISKRINQFNKDFERLSEKAISELKNIANDIKSINSKIRR